MDSFIKALALVGTPETIVAITVSCLFGLFVGAIPGLTATMAVALLVPFTFYMSPIPAIATVIACTAMAITAGDIPSALLKIPGTPSSAAYTDEAYAMTKKGKGAQALGISIVASCIGGLFGFVVLAFTAPALARVALRFSSFEYFWLAILGLSCAALVSSSGVIKGVLALFLGLALSTIGADPLTGTARFTFGNLDLTGGLSFVPAMIGLFALGELLRYTPGAPGLVAATKVKNPYAGVIGILNKHQVNLWRGSALGTVIGALPGAGGDLGAWISYAMAKRFSKTPEKFGKGHEEGLVEAGASNNSALSAAWIPAMVFGIPGDAVTAIAVGILFMKGLNPGPQLFTSHPENFYAVMLIFVIANLLLIPLGYLAVRAANVIFGVPRAYLNGAIMIFCLVGAYAANNSMFDVVIMTGFGVLAYLLQRAAFPIAPIILGMVMGPLVEQNFLTSMIISQGDILGFFSRPIAAGLGIVVIVLWSLPPISWVYGRLRGKSIVSLPVTE
ncbi:tripartite tricarboxylate transporter permease [Microvirga sp. TS319]|uniref:tripartite tricarboxylate transporter permease n=1 Tax=Microvirga sp. TS319 TaxID=3241165 RepID=UPI003519E0C2